MGLSCPEKLLQTRPKLSRASRQCHRAQQPIHGNVYDSETSCLNFKSAMRSGPTWLFKITYRNRLRGRDTPVILAQRQGLRGTELLN